jgi:RNA polymerase primary sigma factor
MELRHLRYFVAIAEEQSFTRAAERLWVAQPGLSTQIRRLEEELGIKLFERNTRGVDLTDAGEAFLERARVALAAADDARAVGSALASGLVGAIRLGIASGPESDLVPSLLERFAATRPDVELTVLESFGGTLARDLRDGRLDAMVAPSVFGSPELQRIQLTSEPLVVLAAAGHRLGRPGPIAADELEGEHVIVTGHRDGAGYDRYVTDTLVELGVTPVTMRGGPGGALFGAVLRGEAVGLSTAAGAAAGARFARPLRSARELGFELLWRNEMPSPALGQLIRVAQSLAHAESARRDARAAPGGGMSRPALLTAADEVRLAKLIERGDLEARQEMIERNLGLVVALARPYADRGLPLDDLVQEGAICLVRAVEKFDHRRGHKFSTYAVWWIRRSLMNALGTARTIRIPSSAGLQLAAIKRAEAELGPVSDEAIAEQTGLAPRTVGALRSAAQVTASLDAVVAEGASPLADLIADDAAPAPWERAGEIETQAQIARMLKALPARHREVLMRRYGLNDAPVQGHDEIAAWLGVGTERSRQIEREALHRLRELGGGRERAALAA